MESTKSDCYLMNNPNLERYKACKLSGLIDWCLTPTLAIFQLYRGVQVIWRDTTY